MASKQLIVGCAATGAKFTKHNHRTTGDTVMDHISTGASIKIAESEALQEAVTLYALGCRYYHYHARNPATGEQSTDNAIYQSLSQSIQRSCNQDIRLSFGASRNGPEVRDSIARNGEWERVSQCSIPLHLGGAHFVTMQAAVELQIMCDIERKYGVDEVYDAPHEQLSRIIHEYRPSGQTVDADLATHSTAGGSNYGTTSPAIQFATFARSIQARRQIGLFDEVEWVQRRRSVALTRFAIERPDLRLGAAGQLNVTILFGFSPALPFPMRYSDFKTMVRAAKSLEYDLGDKARRRRHVTVAVGAAVLPQQAKNFIGPLDVGPERGRIVTPVERLVQYAAQRDSGVDIVRVGMEDTPFDVTADGDLRSTTNAILVKTALHELERAGATPLTRTQEIDRLAVIAGGGDRPWRSESVETEYELATVA
ncbi:3-keto-5-aminohexanoate cleavage protein [Nocardia bovistercoris]|uniref:3-keto-5-aminohexanoate cleavage protein n=1 Tax=Nocardia bovistercoris TaxID=2785916 RepID=A0A931IJM1_9NOCA|nr:3-keto-5-aminohexanoate cleavage protein [Nocardia bovistercoris]MBH0780880.1 3-keto-5-aminohexanoate cleavage protein [Nocardia bovistercoris]